jgi:hypothetical protein
MEVSGQLHVLIILLLKAEWEPELLDVAAKRKTPTPARN